MMQTDKLRIMVVDDEEIPRRFLKICLDWEEIGMEIVCEASSGREALDLIDEYNPDIVFTDIQMPFMDGLEFSKNVSVAYPHIKIVILTAHKTFDYAQDSIRIGVSDFLLKPINKAEVLKIVLNLKEEILSERKHWNEFNAIKKQLQENFLSLREKFLVDMLENSSNTGSTLDKLRYFYSDSVPTYFKIAVIETFYPEISKEVNEERRLILALGSNEITKQYFRDDLGVDVIFDNSQKIVIYATIEEMDLLARCEQLKLLINNKLNCSTSIGIGNGYQDFKLISKSYREASEALKFSVISGRNHVICINDDMHFSDRNWDIKTEHTNELSFLIKASLDEKAVFIVEELFTNMSQSRTIAIEQVRVVAINIISAILEAVAQMGLDYKEIFETVQLPYNKVFEIDTMQNMKDYLIELILTSSGTIRVLRTRKSKTLIEDIKDYMKNNMANGDLSLSSIAQDFYVNPSYLSRIFKQEMGQNFSKYLTKLRMEKAIEIINETDMKAYQVAEAVGIKDPYYFSNCFKKFTGLSVNDYKK